MNNAQGGYKIIDFKGVDLINEETPNTSIYKAIEESYKSKALLLSNIVIDKIEYNAVFKEIKHIDNYYTFEMYNRIIKVFADKVESLSNVIIKTIDYNDLENTGQETSAGFTKKIDISSLQSSRITITNFEEGKDLKINLGFDKKGIYSYLLSQPFETISDSDPTYSNEISIDSYDFIANEAIPYTDMILGIKNNLSNTTIIIDVNKVNNTFIINIVNGMEF